MRAMLEAKKFMPGKDCTVRRFEGDTGWVRDGDEGLLVESMA
jgi:hypothetical protein